MSYTKFHKVISQSFTKYFYNKIYFVRLGVVLGVVLCVTW